MTRNKVKKCIIITTIGAPTDEILSWMEEYSKDWHFIIVGDRKTPHGWDSTFIDYLSVDRQHELFSEFSSIAPLNHYSRKNLGYLHAISQGAEVILETDDDNFPLAAFGKKINPWVTGRLVGEAQWINIYRYFSEENIWPRGLPLDTIHQMGKVLAPSTERRCPVQQFLVDEDPDVDAIWRLVFNSASVVFNPSVDPVILDTGAWVPFNSQNTLFFSDAFPLLYLPHHVSFRMTDIWRSFVAQAALWTAGDYLAFHTSTARQIRNQHNLMADFEQEVPGYLSNREICAGLTRYIEEKSGHEDCNLLETARQLWLEMIRIGVVPATERPLIEGWYSHLSLIYQRH